MRDLQLHLDQSDPQLVRRTRDTLRAAKAKGHALVLLGCRLKLPAELEHEFTVIDLALPGPGELEKVLDGILQSAGAVPPSAADKEAALRNAAGLTTVEAENVFALSLVRTGKIDAALVASENSGFH